jgi:hypothetical protein
MTCKHCGLSDNSLSIHTNIDSLPTSSNSASKDLWTLIQTFDIEIARVDTLLKGLVLKRALLKRKFNYHSSPLLKIPPDLTSEIFKACLAKEDQALGTASARGHAASESPLLLGSICSTWRALAWSSPWIWSSISLALNTPSPTRATFVDEWLSRSGGCTLTISLKCPVLRTEYEDTVRGVIGVVARFSERWGRISFSLPLSCYDVLRSVEGRVPLLESVSVELGGYFDGDPLRMFSVAPKLREVHCEHFPHRSVVFPLAQLTDLPAYHCNIMECLDVVEIAARLTHASFKITTFRWTPKLEVASGSTSTPVGLQQLHQVFATRLRSLQLSVPTPRIVATLLDNLILPTLRELSISNAALAHSGPFTHIPQFIKRSACSLLSLSLIGLQLNDDDLLQCMQVMPSLIELTISDSYEITKQTIRNLTPNMTLYPPLLPNLQRLEISSFGLTIDYMELHGMLRARWVGAGRGIARLESVVIGDDYLGQDARELGIPLLQELIAEGMHISLKPRGGWS